MSTSSEGEVRPSKEAGWNSADLCGRGGRTMESSVVNYDPTTSTSTPETELEDDGGVMSVSLGER